MCWTVRVAGSSNGIRFDSADEALGALQSRFYADMPTDFEDETDEIRWYGVLRDMKVSRMTVHQQLMKVRPRYSFTAPDDTVWEALNLDEQ